MRYGRKTKALTRLWLCVAGFLSLFLVCCFKGPNGTTAGGPPISITLSAYSQILGPGGTVNITAVVYDQSGQGVTWNLAPINFGALSNPTSSSVTYTAPGSLSTPTTVTVTATSITNPNVTASTKISISPLITLSVISNPATNQQSYSAQTINQGSQLLITAISPGTGGGNVDAVWSLSPASGAGSLSSQTGSFVTYVAPSTVASATTVIVTAQSVGSSATGSLQITVLPSGAGPNVTTGDLFPAWFIRTPHLPASRSAIQVAPFVRRSTEFLSILDHRA